MVRIGVTGLMASGKSTVARRFQRKGAALLDADGIGWEVLRRPEVRDALARAFGAAVVLQDGFVDRGVLGRIVFRDPAALTRLNAIVQPTLQDCVRAALVEPSRGERVRVLDAALLTTWHLEPELDGVVEVVALPRERMERLKRARGFTEEEAWVRVRGQTLPPVRDARRYWRIENHGTASQLEARADVVWAEILAIGEAPAAS